MKKYKCILFDLDGTLVNTEQGILNSYRYAIEKLNLQIDEHELSNEVIGAPLLDVFKNRFQLEDTEARNAVDCYRTYYAENGWKEAELYHGIVETLKELKNRGKVVGVTTLKKETFAIQMLKMFEVDQYIDVIYGMDGQDNLTKSMLLNKAMNTLNCLKEETVLVGDSFYDEVGANEAGTGFVGVTYGFGFKKETEIGKGNILIDEISQLLDIV